MDYLVAGYFTRTKISLNANFLLKKEGGQKGVQFAITL